MITIHNLEVRFEVEGEDDSERFAELFERFIRRWQEQLDEERARVAEATADRSLGDLPREGMPRW